MSSMKEPKGIYFEEKEGNLYEGRVVTDEVIRDPNSPLATQIPEGVGADGPVDDGPGARFAALREGHVEAKFGTTAAPLPSRANSAEGDEHTRAVGAESGDDFEPALEAEPVGPAIYSEPKKVSAGEEGTDHSRVDGRNHEVEEKAAKDAE